MRDNNADNDFIRSFRHIWADNGDAISFHYTGTGSTHTEYDCFHIVSLAMVSVAGWAILSTNIRQSHAFTIKISGISTK